MQSDAELRKLCERLRAHVIERDGPKANGAWQMMLDAADAIDALLSRLEAEAWRDISTAPKDGSPVDVWCGDTEEGYRICDAYFGRPQHHTCTSDYCDSCPEDRDVEAWRDPMGGYQLKPTHYMPLPTPPERRHG